MKKLGLVLLLVCLAAITVYAESVEIVKVTKNNNFSVTAQLRIKDAGGNVIFDDTRGFTNTTADKIQAVNKFKEGVENIILQIKTEKAAVLGDEIKKIEGQTIEISTVN